MAIFHFNVKSISRAKAQSAVASATYRRAEKLYDQRLDQIQNYSKEQQVVFSEFMIPSNAPVWLQTIAEQYQTEKRLAVEQFWNTVEASEKRNDEQLAREVEFALPIELEQSQAIALAREFIQDQFVLRGMVADWSVHWEKNNPHVHVMLTMRELVDTGFGKKNRDWNNKLLLKTWREKWAEYANFHLHMHHHAMRIDHRSYQEQGIDLIPTLHQGGAVIDMHKRGISSDILHEAKKINRENLTRIVANPTVLFKKITTQTDTFTQEQIGQELNRYINDKNKIVSTTKPAAANISTINPTKSPSGLPTKEKLAATDIANILKRITYHESVFTERDIAKAVSACTDDAELFARALIQIKAAKELMPLGKSEDGRDRFTTRQMFALENKTQYLADRLKKRSHIACSQRKINKLLTKHEAKTNQSLTTEQRTAVLHILKPKAISCLIGRAGTGKSFSLGAAKTVWEAQGLNVQGVTLSGIAADGLIKDVGIPSRTIASFQHALDQGRIKLSSKDVIVMDEAGMTDVTAMHAILQAVNKAHAKLVLVGDPDQLQPVGPGASFRALLERIGFAEIQTIYRQQQEWQRAATPHLASGKINKAIDAYQVQGCVHLQPTSKQAMQQLVDDWLAARHQSASIEQSLILAHRNEDVNAINTMVRVKHAYNKVR